MTKINKNHSSYSTNYHPEQKINTAVHLPVSAEALSEASSWLARLVLQPQSSVKSSTCDQQQRQQEKKNPWWSNPPSWLVCRCEAERSDTDWWRVEPNVRPTASLTLLIALAFFLPQEPVKNELWASLPLLSSWEWFCKNMLLFFFLIWK